MLWCDIKEKYKWKKEKNYREISLYKLKCIIIYSEEEWIIYNNNNVLIHSLEISMDADGTCKRKTKISGVSP